ncbi:unnamed protein product [Rotaria magnacalcarata]|uniref:Glucose-methanol-choline oxidoreductase N-terminal domain-containing protein n=1 Tax=Rotaria magnacalcarata TaxID=392030 RepID=A0A819SBN8_9BILA|nr:unnamed protein product [Rotaria magnacalcarata]CAF4056942.1 unnamed protein product [Rotaria magnacalcarata]
MSTNRVLLGSLIVTLVIAIGACIWGAVMTSKFVYATRDNEPLCDNGKQEEFDFVVVGLGAGGSVIASRLSEIPQWTILAIDRGPNEVSTDVDPTSAISGYSFVSPHDPVATSLPLAAANKKIMYVPRFNGLGGTARLYGGINVRPSRTIMRRWPSNWTYDDLLPYYKKIEDHYCYYYDANSTGISNEDCNKYHGKNGPLQVNPTYIPEFANVSKLFEPLCGNSSLLWGGYNADINGANHIGCALFQRYFNRKGNRTDVQSDYFLGTSFQGYITADVIKRTNLRVRAATTVLKILFDTSAQGPAKARGVIIQNSTGIYTIYVRKEVIVAGGAFSTPHLLQVSGIGDPAILLSAQIPLVAANKYVGRNLRDHVAVPMVFQVKDKFSTYPNYPNTNKSSIVYKKSIPNGSKSWLIALNAGVRPNNITDLQIYFSDTNYHSPDSFGNSEPRQCRFGSNGYRESPAEITLRMILQDPTFLGTVTATSDNIYDKPLIDFKWDNITDYEYEVFNKTIVAIQNLVNTTQWGLLLGGEVFPGPDTPIKTFIDGHLETALHPISTCQMGLCSDTRLRVLNTTNVRVCDTSAFGGQVDGNPSATIFALAERLYDILRQDYGYNVQQKNMKTVIDDGERAVSDGETISPEMLQHLKDYSEYFSYAA